MDSEALIFDFVTTHQLPDSFIHSARDYFYPLALSLMQQAEDTHIEPLMVGIHGCQGSGKSTLTEFLVSIFEAHGIASVGVSIDDFYLTKAQRVQLANQVHPLLATRGVPGTHDLPLMLETLTGLKNSQVPSKIPRFNKALDDRFEVEHWSTIETTPSIILFEGWCVACPAQSIDAIDEPVNPLEALEDASGDWRRYVNNSLSGSYQDAFSLIDRLVMLQAPSFSAVAQWREQQEVKLRARVAAEQGDAQHVMSPEQITRFIAHYQRITEHALQSLPSRADDLFKLDESRQIVATEFNLLSVQ